MSSDETITAGQVIRRVPNLIARTPDFLKAGRVLNPLRKQMSLGRVIAEAAVRHGDRPALIQDDRSVSYRQFNEQANRIAHFLLSQGIERGDVVALMMENRPEFLICAIGIAKVGAVASLLNTSQTGKVLTHSINLVKPKMVICGGELTGAIDEIRDQLDVRDDRFYCMPDVDTLREQGEVPEGWDNLAAETASQSTANPEVTEQIGRKDELFYIYTSGTTGLPKASITNHERWLAAHAGFGHVIAGMRAHDVFYLTLPLYHATGLLVCWGAVVAGPAAVVLRRRFSASEFWSDIRRYQCTGFGYVGELCRYLLNRPVQPDDADNRVRLMIGNGLRPQIWKQFKERFGIERVLEFYASSEGNVAFLNLFSMDNTIGFGGGNIALVKYDRDADQPVRDEQGHLIPAARGEAGLLIGKVTAATPFVGYTQKEKTEAALLRNVFKEGDSYFNTGDLVKEIGCRHYQFVDRTGDTFRWKGENVSTTELESILASHPQIAEAVVYGVQIPETDGRAGMAAITPDVPESELDLENVLGYLRTELPPYAVPLFLRLRQSMETTGTFKYKKADLKKEAFNPEAADDPLFVLLPGEKTYVPLTADVYEKITNGAYRF